MGEGLRHENLVCSSEGDRRSPGAPELEQVRCQERELFVEGAQVTLEKIGAAAIDRPVETGNV